MKDLILVMMTRTGRAHSSTRAFFNLTDRRFQNTAAGFFTAVITIWLAILVCPGAALGNLESFAEPDPPRSVRDADLAARTSMASRTFSPALEWEYHKTPDNRHPDENEQQLMWLLNRARSNPTLEGIRLANIYDQYYTYLPDCSQITEDIDVCYIAGALDYWGVDLDRLQNEFAGYDTKAPAAFDVRLYRAAKNHSEYLISIDGQNHTDQFNRIDDENFYYRRARGNVFSYSLSAAYGHAAFNVDWGDDGNDGSGMQPGRGHRLAIMSIDGDYTNVGIAAVPVSNSAATVGPLVITGNFCEANTSADNHFNRFLVGTVWTDKDDDDFFDAGEGLGNVMVRPDRGVYYALTSSGGGYALPITEAGMYEVTFSGAALSGEFVKTVLIGDESVLLDLVDVPNSALPAADSKDENNPGGGSGGGGGCFIAAIPACFNATKESLSVIIFCSVILIGSAASGRRKKKK